MMASPAGGAGYCGCGYGTLLAAVLLTVLFLLADFIKSLVVRQLSTTTVLIHLYPGW